MLPREYEALAIGFLGSAWVFARNLAVYRSSYAFLIYLVHRLSGKHYFITCVVAGLCSGVMISLLIGLRGQSAITVAVASAFMCGLAFQVQSWKARRNPGVVITTAQNQKKKRQRTTGGKKKKKNQSLKDQI